MSEDIQKKLKENREAIDGIDRDVVRLLCERVQHAAEIGQIKHAHGADFYDPAREAQVMDKIAALNPRTIPEKTPGDLSGGDFRVDCFGEAFGYCLSRAGSDLYTPSSNQRLWC